MPCSFKCVYSHWPLESVPAGFAMSVCPDNTPSAFTQGRALQKFLAATPFKGALDLKGVEIGGLQKFLQSPALVNTDGVLSGHTDIANQAGKVAASGQMTVDKPKLHGIEMGYPINGGDYG